jgi:hypothetical protein
MMKMKLNLVLNYTSFKYFMKMIRIKGFRNSKNQSQDWIRGSIENKKEVKIGLIVHFEIKNWTTPTTTGVQPPTCMQSCLLKTNHVVYKSILYCATIKCHLIRRKISRNINLGAFCIPLWGVSQNNFKLYRT